MKTHLSSLVSVFIFIVVAIGLSLSGALENHLVVMLLALAYFIFNLIYWLYKHELSWQKIVEFGLLTFIGYYSLVYLI